MKQPAAVARASRAGARPTLLSEAKPVPRRGGAGGLLAVALCDPARWRLNLHLGAALVFPRNTLARRDGGGGVGGEALEDIDLFCFSVVRGVGQHSERLGEGKASDRVHARLARALTLTLALILTLIGGGF